MEQHLAAGGLHQAGNHLYRSAFAGAVWSKIAQNFSRADGKAHLTYGGKAGVTLRKTDCFKHKVASSTPSQERHRVGFQSSRREQEIILCRTDLVAVESGCKACYTRILHRVVYGTWKLRQESLTHRH